MQQQDLNLFETSLDETAKAHLLETTRWTKFIGICAILIVILFATYTLFTMRYLSAAMANSDAQGYQGVASMVTTITIVVMIALYCYPIYALLRFSSSMKKGIQSNNQDLINEGFRYQKNMFRYTGILLIISLVTILLSFIIGGAGMLTGA